MTTILVVDDSATSRLLFKAYMPKDAGLEIHEAEDAASALRQARALQPDLMVLDYNLPDHNGDHMMDLFQSIDQTRQIPVYVVSADARPELIERMNKMGIASYLTKPIDFELLLQILDDQEQNHHTR